MRETSAVDLLGEFTRLYHERRLNRIRDLYHPQGRFVTMAGGPEPLGPEETFAAVERAMRDFVYRAWVESDPVAIDSCAAYLVGAIRHRTPDGSGHVAAGRVWLYTVKDGLLYRAVPLADVAAAQELYAREGIELGF